MHATALSPRHTPASATDMPHLPPAHHATPRTRRPVALALCTAALLGLGLTQAAQAQSEDPAHPSTTPAEAALTHWPAAGNANYPEGEASPIARRAPSQRTEIGLATNTLLDLQRNSEGQHLRYIDGEQASRSYARYLKSFETTIPEQFETGIDTGVD